jgi:hypothetical protein
MGFECEPHDLRQDANGLLSLTVSHLLIVGVEAHFVFSHPRIQSKKWLGEY